MAVKLVMCVAFSVLCTIHAQILNPHELEKYLGAPCRIDTILGECIHLFLCNATTNKIIEDGAGVFNPRLNEAPIECPLPLLCCGSENNVSNPGVTTPPVDRQTTLQRQNKDQQVAGAKCRMNSGLGECVHSYLCNTTTETIIEDGSTIFDPRISEEPIDCPPPFVCCGSETNTIERGAKTHVKPSAGVCGWRNSQGVDATRKVKANQAKLGEFPWLINVMKFMDQTAMNLRMKHLGDGALIHTRAALTAAHSVGDYDVTVLRVVAGEYDMSPEPAQARLVRLVRSVRKHPNYQKENLRNDFAILFLEADIEFKPQIAPICLASPTTDVPVGTRCIAAGWGKDRRGVVQTVEAMVELPIVEHGVCQDRQRTTNAGLYYNLHESFICAGGEIGPDTCRGSGGAALVCPIDSQPGRYVAVGVSSFDMACGANGVPAVYAKVAYARQWIDRTMAEEGLSTDSYTL